MEKILTHGFEKEYNERIERMQDLEKQALMAVIERRQKNNGHTKASLIRAEFQSNKRGNNSFIEPQANLY